VVEKSAANDPSVVIPLLQDVEVRATGQITSEQFASMRKRADVSADTDPYAQQRYSTVTVAIQPQDAQKLILAQRLGKIIATLRNPDDRATMTSGVDAVDLDAIVSGFRPQRMRPVAATHVPGPPGVEYIVGGAGNRGGASAPGLGAALPPGDPSLR